MPKKSDPVSQKTSNHQLIQQRLTEIREVYSGPLPMPEVLRAYDEILPGAAERILKLTEQQAEHRCNVENVTLQANIEARDKQLKTRDRQLNLEERKLKNSFQDDLYGKTLGWLIGVACVGGAIWSMINDKNPWVTVAFLGLPVATIIKAIRSSSSPKR